MMVDLCTGVMGLSVDCGLAMQRPTSVRRSGVGGREGERERESGECSGMSCRQVSR